MARNTTAAAAIVPRRGRPRKFTAPSRPITVTLPEHVIQALTALDSDLGRALISFDQPMTSAGLELLIEDALEDRALPAAERDVFQALGGILKTARRSDQVVLLQRNVIVLETRRAAAPLRRISK